MSDDGGHTILTLVGLVAVALGVLMIVQPGLAATIGTGYTAVTIVALLALVQGIRVARARKATELQSAKTPDVEAIETVPTPGDDFDREVAGLRSGPRRMLIRRRADLRETLEAAAITAVADRENCSRAEARERVESGTWTDDVHAASFLGGSEAPNPSLLARMRIAVGGQSSRQFRIRRTADAIARVAGVTDESEQDDGGTDGSDEVNGVDGRSGSETDDRSESGRGAQTTTATEETAERREAEA